jgi:hypothetical protein
MDDTTPWDAHCDDGRLSFMPVFLSLILISILLCVRQRGQQTTHHALIELSMDVKRMSSSYNKKLKDLESAIYALECESRDNFEALYAQMQEITLFLKRSKF